MNKKIIFFLLLMILIIPIASARIVSNSQDWRDAYSTMLYGKLMGDNPEFLVSQQHSRIILQSGSIQNTSITLVNSPKLPFAYAYQNLLESNGAKITVIETDNNNLALSKKTNVSNFVVIDDAYGYNAVSVGSYALLSRSYVLFMNNNNYAEVSTFLDERKPAKILIYGHVDREVKDVLTKYNPEIINLEDRFLNNIEIAKKFIELKATISRKPSQALLTNGEFIEDTLINTEFPVLFIGKNNIPDALSSYLRSDSGIAVGVLVGNQYVGAATELKRRLGISVFVKFGRSARANSGGVNSVEGLDMFPLPIYDVLIDIDSVRYNQATKQLEVTIKNLKELIVYFKGTYAISSSTGVDGVVGDNNAQFLEKGATKTITYDIDLTSKENLKAQALVLFGESPNSMEFALDKAYNISTIKVLDDSEIILVNAAYDKNKGDFLVQVKNTGKITSFVTAEAIDIKIAGEKYAFGADKITEIKSGKTKLLQIKSEPKLTEADFESNKIITIEARYGARENSLVKRIRGEFAFMLKGADYVLYILIIIVLILFLLILFSKKKKRKEKQEK